MTKRTRKVPLGNPAPPAPESELTPEALRARAETMTLQWWYKYAPRGWETLLESPAIDLEGEVPGA